MMAAMQTIAGQWFASLGQYVLMSLLSTPARLPRGAWPIAPTVAAYFIVAIPLASQDFGYPGLAARVLLDLVLLALLCWAGLAWRGKLPRFAQTFSALVGINVVITLATLPLYGWGDDALPDPLLIFAPLIWNLAALSLVISRALEVSTPLAALLTFNYVAAFHLIAYLVT